MKANTHPEFRLVLFKDITCDFSFVAGTAADPKTFAGTETVDGVEYPVVKIDISSASHPFYTGKQKALSTQGNVEKFLRKYGMLEEAKAAAAAAEAAEAAAAAEATASDA